MLFKTSFLNPNVTNTFEIRRTEILGETNIALYNCRFLKLVLADVMVVRLHFYKYTKYTSCKELQ